MTLHNRTPITSTQDKADGLLTWDWLDNNPDVDGSRRFWRNRWEAQMVNGRIIRGAKPSPILGQSGWYQLSVKCINDPANPKTKTLDIHVVEDGGLVEAFRVLIRQWRDEPEVRP
jgi:hypothetical protein